MNNRTTLSQNQAPQNLPNVQVNVANQNESNVGLAEEDKEEVKLEVELPESIGLQM